MKSAMPVSRIRIAQEVIRSNFAGLYPDIVRRIGIRPLYANFWVTTRCSGRCQTCTQWREDAHEEMDTRELKDVLLRLKKAGVAIIYFVGGDVFLRDDIFELIQFAGDLGLRSHLTINAYTVTEDIARALAASKVASLHLSLDTLYVGRLEKLKGVQTLIPLFRRYPRAQLWIVGSGSLERRLRHMAEDCSNIRFLGRVPYNQLHSIYRNAVALIVPSLFYEISPLVIIEAGRHRIPVIARNRGRMAELVAESGGGIVYDTQEELIAAMDRLCSDPSLRKSLGGKGYAACRGKWSAESYMSGYLNLIAGIAEKRGIVLR